MADALARFHPAIRAWFSAAFAAPTRPQQLAWPALAAGESTLVFAPTGSGKTLAAFLAALDRLMFGPGEGCRIVYVSPLRALAVDVEKNLRVPLDGIADVARARGDAFRVPTVGIRTGDTPASDRARLVRRPPDILITTPESLFLMLTSRARHTLAGVEALLLDEIHVLVGTKRGAHLAISAERLQEATGRPLQRVGLSATQRPLEEVARYLGGGTGIRRVTSRPVTVIDARGAKGFDLRVEVPAGDMALRDVNTDAPGERSIWPRIHPRLLELIRAHRSTLVFVNSRRLAERLAGALNDLAGEELVRAHHGSLAREERLAIEDALKAGRLPALVATSSLELGIDMGAIDLVIQVEAPPSVASGLQRVGRAGHQVGHTSRAVIFPKYRGDLLAAAATTRAMLAGDVEETRIPQNPLDVLAQQVVSIATVGERTVDSLHRLVRGAAPYARLSRAQLEGVLDMLSGRYPSDEFADLRPRLVWDRAKDTVRAREGAFHLVVTSAGTIPDRGLYGVYLAEGGATPRPGPARAGRRVGELDEEMVFESREGDVFVLGATSWRIVEITRDRVMVEPAPGEPGRMPFWKADRPARPAALGAAIGRLARELLAAPPERAAERLRTQHALDPRAAENLLAYLAEQKAAAVVPDDRTLVLERTRDEMGDWRLCLLSPFGGRVHAPLGMVLRARLRETEGEVDLVSTDDGLVIRLSDRESPPQLRDLLPAPEEVEPLLLRELGGTSLFAAHFREAAGRALLLPRRRPGQRAPLWMQRKRSADLLSVAARYGSFPIILETYRECLQDVFDLPALVDLLGRVRQRQVHAITVDTARPSPFAASLLFGYVANYLYEGDAPLAERRAQALTVDQAQLRDLLGEAELRTLLDPAVLADLPADLQALSPARRIHPTPDRLCDLLLRLGDLDAAGIAARCDADPAAALEALRGEGRVIAVTVAGAPRFIAVEDAGRYRDACGTPLPAGVPGVFRAAVGTALADLVARHARTHGPFTAAEAAHRYGVEEGSIEAALEQLAAAGRVVEGEFRPGGHGREWCDAGVLATLRRRSRARLRQQVEPAPPEALARFLLAWHGIGGASRSGPDALLDVVEQLQGAPLVASDLESAVLPARLPGYRPADLDLLCAAGEVVLVGLAPLGERDGRLTFALADARTTLGLPGGPRAEGSVAAALRDHLHREGASFFADLHAAAPGPAAAAVDALWDLWWAGEVTCDAPAALRAFLHPPDRNRRVPAPGGFRSRRLAPPSAVGRWSLLPAPARPLTPTALVKAMTEQLLARHGILTRAATQGENLVGRFAAAYPVLRALEDAGRVRRGYFVAGLGGSQFASPGAVERLREVREAADEPTAVVLAATDPANPWGATLPWPEGAGGRLQRAAGARVVLVEGVLTAWVSRGARELIALLPAEDPVRTRLARATAQALRLWAEHAPGRTLAPEPTLAPFLLAAGFVPAGGVLRLPARAPFRAEQAD